MTTEGKPVLPAGYALRHPTAADMPAAQHVLDASESADCGEPRRHEYDLVVLSRDPSVDMERDEWVVESPDGELCAMAWIWPSAPPPAPPEIVGNAFVHPDHRGKGIGRALLEVVETRAAEGDAGPPGSARSMLYAWVEDVHPGWRGLLTSRGFASARQSYEMRIDLAGPRASPAWPEGIEARAFRVGWDDRVVWRADEEAFAEHFLFESQAFEEWRVRHLERRDADPALWVLAWDGDELAGYVLGFDADEGGSVGDLAVRRRWRGRGLGSALLEAEFGLFAARGRRVVRLDVDVQNVTGALRVYQRAGMTVERRFDVMEKPLA